MLTCCQSVLTGLDSRSGADWIPTTTRCRWVTAKLLQRVFVSIVLEQWHHAPGRLTLEPGHFALRDAPLVAKLPPHLIIYCIHGLAACQEAIEALHQVREATNDVLQGLHPNKIISMCLQCKTTTPRTQLPVQAHHVSQSAPGTACAALTDMGLTSASWLHFML